MNCIKPSGPYIAFLVVIFSISFVGIPKNGQTRIEQNVSNLAQQELEEDGLKQIDNISMLNIHDYE